MALARRVYFWAGIYGILVLAPGFFSEEKTGRDFPPAITHPEYYYGFISVGLAWQFLFLLLSKDPVRFRPLMPAAMAEKFFFLIAALALYFTGRLPGLVLGFAMFDGVLGLLFLAAYIKTAGEKHSP